MELKSGDIFYIKSNNQYFVYKLLKKDKETGIHHVLVYKPFDLEPKGQDFVNLEIYTAHIPIDTPKDYKIIGHDEVSISELQGFYDYLKLTDFARYLEETDRKLEDVVNAANEHFRQADEAYKAENYRLAIQKYTDALNEFPLFYEAIDRRAFTKMALGEFIDAIKDFQFSLMINPNSVIAEFAIGECYYKLGDFEKAVEQFDRTVKMFPDDSLSQEWLEMSKRELAALNN